MVISFKSFKRKGFHVKDFDPVCKLWLSVVFIYIHVYVYSVFCVIAVDIKLLMGETNVFIISPNVIAPILLNEGTYYVIVI